jgi:WD40 repeat protein
MSITDLPATRFAQAISLRSLWSTGVSLLLLAAATPVNAREPLTLSEEELGKGITYVQHLAFSADSKVLAIAWDKGIVLWDVENGKKLDTVFEMGGYGGIAFSPDGKLFAAADAHGTHVWDLATGKKKHTFKQSDPLSPEGRSNAFSPDGKMLAVSGWNHSATLFDTDSGKEIAKLEGQKEVVTLAFDKNGETLATASKYGTVVIWDVKKREKIKTLDMSHISGIGSMSYSADGKSLVTDGRVKTYSMLAVWDVEKGEIRRTYGGVKPKLGDIAVYGAPKLTPDGKSLAFGCNMLLCVMPDIDSGDPPQLAPGYKSGSAIRAIAISPDGKLVAVAAGADVKIVDAPKKKKD